MKYLIFFPVVMLLTILNVGFYNEVSDGEVSRIFFIKKNPTFRVRFSNIHANDGDYRKVGKLTSEQKQNIIDYCKYRLGIDTAVTTQADVEDCSKR